MGIIIIFKMLGRSYSVKVSKNAVSVSQRKPSKSPKSPKRKSSRSLARKPSRSKKGGAKKKSSKRRSNNKSKRGSNKKYKRASKRDEDVDMEVDELDYFTDLFGGRSSVRKSRGKSGK